MTESNFHVTELLPGYALGILDEAETGQVRAHLQVCEDCTRELETYQPVLAGLGQSGPQAVPPADLRSRILAQADQEAAASRLAGAQPRKARSFWRGLFSWRLAGALVILLLVGSNLLAWQRVGSLSSIPEINSFRTVALAGTDNSPGARGVLIISHDGKYGTLVVDDLPELEEGYQYQLWLTNDGNRISGGLFSVSKSGYAAMEIWTKEPLDSFDAFGITVEPAGGSPGPTGEKVMGGGL